MFKFLPSIQSSLGVFDADLSSAIVLTEILVLAATCVFVGWIIYNIYLRPLASFPGPKANAAIPFPLFHSMLGGTLPMDAQKLHARYGDVVRIAPSEITFTDPGEWKEIFAIRAGKPQR